ncbi:hypothetical protein GPAL_0987 [Glaciecola pallidula DSM 14239 = ACAM 615]|uniref:Uncharacterized protein n=1 Tax=Brumicola pallidula DSM 14239 = ACAM 615 TaxID=1121922 RepID=K6YV77_9ALTE|nr:hypothetical protein GPAL_0987 [Glaciecola pallidula DSM 14239 = ACAM 615]
MKTVGNLISQNLNMGILGLAIVIIKKLLQGLKSKVKTRL